MDGVFAQIALGTDFLMVCLLILSWELVFDGVSAYVAAVCS